MAQWPLDEDLEVVNEDAERAIKDVTEYAHITQDGITREDHIVVANCHQVVFHSLKHDAPRKLRM